MQDLTKSQKARLAVRSFQTIAHALALRGFYRPSEKMGQSLIECLMNLSPEIYGSMNDPRIVELKGLEYVMDRLPRGIEQSIRIILTEEGEFDDSPFERVVPPKRRRNCYRISDTEFCMVITRGLSEIYDFLTHISFLCIEARKIYRRMKDEAGNTTVEWLELEETVRNDHLTERDLQQALWNLSIILGRSYHETRNTYEYFKKNRQPHKSGDFFSLIYHLGKRMDDEEKSRAKALVIYLTPSLMNIIGHQRYGEKWAGDIQAKLKELNLESRPLHIISANLHSILNLLYAHSAIGDQGGWSGKNLCDFVRDVRERTNEVGNYARDHGFYPLPDRSGTHIDCQIIDTGLMDAVTFHPEVNFRIPDEKPVILVMDYAFGAQAFEVMDSLLNTLSEKHGDQKDVRSISVMGKAGILPGQKGDIMLATAHVIEGTADNYIVQNDLKKEDFTQELNVYTGPMITVLGTSLQNRDMLNRFQTTWNTVGLEMEGGHYQRAISAALIKGHVKDDIKVRYAYYASDNPLVSGQTLAAGEMGDEGIKPTYMVTRVILEKILKADR
jgi:hypothetical protein